MALTAIMGLPGFSQTIDRGYVTTNGIVNATVQKGDTLYIGGSFNKVGFGFKKLAHFSSGSVKPDAGFPQIAGTVNAIEPDGNGGWYVGGYDIRAFNGTVINNNTNVNVIGLHINPNRSLDTNFTLIKDNNFGDIQSMKKQGNRLYLAGNFSSINGVARVYAAGVDATSGALISWTAPIDENTEFVQKIEASDSLVFLLGGFNYSPLSGSYSSGMLTVKASNASVVKSFPSVNYNSATAFKVNNNKLYVATPGNFAGVASQGITKVNVTTGVADGSFPSTNGHVNYSLSDGSGGYYIAGQFTKVGGIAKTSVAHILSNGTVDVAFTANADYGAANAPADVYALASDGTNLYLGGDFARINNTTRAYMASVLLSSGSLNSWNPAPNDAVANIIYNAGTVYMSGFFTNVKATARNYVAAVTTANVLTNWNPNCNSPVYCMSANPSYTSFFLAGDFTTVKGSPRNYVCKVDNATGALSTWNPNPNSSVTALALSGSTMYIGGSFNTVNGISKQYLAAIDTASNSPTSFSANANSSVEGLNIISNKLYVSGNFTQLQSQPRNYAGRIDLTSGIIDSWNPSLDNYIWHMTGNGTDVIISGYFNMSNAVAINKVFNVDVNSYQPGNFTPVGFTWGSIGSFGSIAVFGNELSVGGSFSYNNGGPYSKSSIIVLDTASGMITRSFDKYPNSIVRSIAATDGKLFVGGNFTSFQNPNGTGAVTRNYLAAYDLSTNTLSSNVYDPDNIVSEVEADANNGLLAAGSFSLIQTVNRNSIAALNLATGFATDFAPSANGTIYSLVAKDSILFVGGSFTTLNSFSRTNLGAINTNTGGTTAWSANANATVYSLVLKDSSLFASGNFTNIKSTARNRCAAVTTGAATVLAWNPNVNNTVNTLLLNGNYLYLGGVFSTVGGTARNYLAKVDNSAGTLQSWNPAPNSNVNVLLKDTGALYVGGVFSSIGGKSIYSAAKFSLATDTLFTGFDAKLRSAGGGTPTVNALANWGSTLFVGSINLNKVNGVNRSFFAGINTVTDSATAFNPDPDNSVTHLNVSANKLYAGGNWSNIDNKLSPSYFAIFTLEPLVQSSGLNFTNLLPQTVTANFTSGTGEKRLVVIRQGGTPAFPEDGRGYTANSTYGSGDTTGTASYVVYNGNSNSVNISNLLPNHSYTVSVYEFNGSGSGADYLASPVLSGSFTTPCPTYNLTITTSGPTTFCSGDSVKLNAPAGFSSYLWSTGSTNNRIKVISSGSYSVTYTDSNGCSGTTPAVVVTVNATPPTPVITPSGSTTFCQGGSVTLTSSAATSYLWSTGATTQSIVVSTSGNYTVAVTNASGCSATSANTVVTVNAVPSTPTISASGSTTLVCPGKTVTLTSSVGTTYLWSTGATTQSIVVSTAGSYTVKVTNAAGCQSASSAATVVTYNVCAKPTGLVTSNITPTAAKLSWAAVTCAVGYQYEYRVKGTIPYTVGQVTGINKTITGLTPGTIYQWRVVTACKINPDTITSNGYTNGAEFTTLSAAFAGNDGGTGLDAKMEKGLAASVMPNPARSIATVRVNNTTGMVHIKLTDLSGKLIWQSKASAENSFDIDVSRLAQGSYMIVVRDDSESKTLKLVKE